MILDEYVEVKLAPKWIKSYAQKGYVGKVGDIIKVVPNDLPSQSHVKIHAKCSICGNIQEISYATYYKSITFDGSYTCKHCNQYKKRTTLIEHYGVPSPVLNEDIKQKMQETCYERYGVTNPMQNATIKNKSKQTCRSKYQCDYALQNPEIRNKIYQTSINKYGVDNVLKLTEIREKIEATMLAKYGVKNCMQNEEVCSQARKTLYANQSQQTSVQQEYLHQLYQGELNYPCSYYSLDIYLLEHKLDIEYNGGGHNLQVKLGDVTPAEFEQKEIIRSAQIRRQGINQLTIISRKDYLPSDDVLLQMLEETLSYLSTTNHHWVEYDIDRSTVRNALGRFPYDFGALRKIKKTDVQDITQDIPEEAS